MADTRQEITRCASKNDNYKQDRLEDLLSAIISKTSSAGTKFSRIEVDGYVDSGAIKVAKTKIRVAEDVANFRMIVRIQMIGFIEIWTVSVYVNRWPPKKIKSLCKEIREASKLVCEEENQKYASPDEGQGAPGPSPDPDPEGSGADGNDGAASPPPKKKRKQITRASSIITEEAVLEILEKWRDLYVGAKKIYQTEFWEILSLLGIDINRLSVLNFLGKKGFIRVVPIRQKPQVEMTQLGSDLMEKHHQQLEAEKSAAEEKERLQKALAFPGEFLSFLKEFQELQAAFAELEKLKTDEKEIPRQIEALQKRLTDIGPAKKKCSETIERLLSQVNKEKIAELAETAERSAQKD
jgi:hypothetical protein